MKKLKSLGRSLSKHEQKKIVGGSVEDSYGPGCIVTCGGETFAINGCPNNVARDCRTNGYYKCDQTTFVTLCL